MALARRTKRVALGFLALGTFAGIAYFSAARLLENQRQMKRHEQERAELQPPKPVAVPVEVRPLRRERKFAASVEPWTEAGVPAEVAGRVVRTAVEAGQKVEEGDLLVEIDDRRARIGVELARTRHTEALRLLGEAQRLKTSRVVSETAYEAAVAEARATKAQLDDAEDLLARHRVTAPFGGYVNERLVDLGDAVTANEAVVRLVDISKLRVVFDVSASDLPAFQPGTVLDLWADGGAKSSPQVKFVARAADPAARLFRVEAELANPDSSLPAGVQGTIVAVVDIFPPGPVVPAAAVRFAGKDAKVLLETPDGPLETRVVVGPEIDGVYPVREGLKAGDRVFLR